MTTANKQPNTSGRVAGGRFAAGNQHAFQKGRSGNPAGRPKTITLSEAYRRELAKVDPTDAQNRTFAEVLAEQAVVKAKTGDVQALREIADRTEGKARQTITLSVERREQIERAIDRMIDRAAAEGRALTREAAARALSHYVPEVNELIH